MATEEMRPEETLNFAKLIDHTLLKPEALPQDIQKLCDEAREWGFYSVCVNPCQVSLCQSLLKDSKVRICTVVGFPLGANEPAVKAFEAAQAIAKGASEVDMVLNIGWLKARQLKAVEQDISDVVRVSQGKVVKVILETCLLSQEEKILACQASMNAGASFVKTSTGFSKAGATFDDVKLLKETVGEKLLVKASGGIRDLTTFKKMIEAGASRIGTSSGVEILSGLSSGKETY